MTHHVQSKYKTTIFYIQVLDVAKSWGAAKKEAERSVSITLNEKKRKLTEAIESDSCKLSSKRGKWDCTIVAEMEGNIEQKKERLENINCLLGSKESNDSKSRQKLKQMQERKAIRVFDESRVKRHAKTT